MADYAQQYPISKMSEVFKVSRSGYYSWLGRAPSKRAKQNERLRRLIHDAWQDSGKLYGSPRIYNQLKTDGCTASRPRIARLMAKMGIASRIQKKWIKTTHSTHGWPVAANVLDRNFAPNGLGQVWVSDITYIRGEQGWMYLTTVMDLGDRQILGWSLSDGMSAEETSIAAFKQAAIRRTPDKQLIFHSDRRRNGVQ
jgi:transposase InsO family protein